jgi:hypothetical protein
MVLGRLIRSIGFRKGPMELEQSGATSVSSEDSISLDADDSSKSTSVDDALIEDSDDSCRSLQCDSSSDYVYPKHLLLCVRAVLRQDASGEHEVMSRKSSARPESEFGLPVAKLLPHSFESFTPKAGSWMAAMQQRKSTISEEHADDERINRKACAILNKLTVEKFDSLFEQLVACGIKKPEHLEMLMSEVFNKATTQHHFVAMYANLCVRLEQDTRIYTFKESGRHRSFRSLLLNQCQVSFEKLLEPDMSKEADVDEEYRLRRKQQALGNIKLIGQLLVHGIVTSKLLVECSEALLRSRSTCAEALESLAALISVAGKQFDNPTWQYHPRLLQVFACMRAIEKDKSVQARVRFLLRDVLDIRDAGWSHSTYKATLQAAPMKLDEVRESAAHAGKHISFHEAVESDNLLTGLQSISKIAATKKEERAPGSKSGRRRALGASSSESPSTTESSSDDGAGDKISEKVSPQGKKNAVKADFTEVTETQAFDVVTFRRALATILTDLSSDRNVPAAVRRIRLQEVPLASQAKEFADIVTRVVEERRGPVRRCALAFAAGLAAAEHSAFDRNACLDGVGLFFNDVYPDLCSEIPRLPAIVASELLPTLSNVFPKPELNKRLPSNLGL